MTNIEALIVTGFVGLAIAIVAACFTVIGEINDIKNKLKFVTYVAELLALPPMTYRKADEASRDGEWTIGYDAMNDKREDAGSDHDVSLC